MGLNKKFIGLVNIGAKYGGFNLNGCEMCELGCQTLYGFSPKINRTAKEYFSELGVKHTSIDINGRYGSLIRDLSEPINEFGGKFDITTNFGTSEHIKDQYNFFLNVHNMTRHGGIIIHVVPPVGEWKNHVCYYYYDRYFFDKLSEKISYKMIFKKIMCGIGSKSPLICIVFQKIKEELFLNRELFNTIGGIIKKRETDKVVSNWGYK